MLHDAATKLRITELSLCCKAAALDPTRRDNNLLWGRELQEADRTNGYPPELLENYCLDVLAGRTPVFHPYASSGDALFSNVAIKVPIH